VHRRHRTIARRIGLNSPLARWGFSICAVVALLNHLYTPALISGAIAAYAWRNR
jgi:hypothetical protein